MSLRGHVVIEGQIECLTGLHIGAGVETIEIGGIDAPVVRNPITREPYIPGSSLKGKVRSLLERVMGKEQNRDGGGGTKRHECETREKAIGCEVCRPFGSTGKDGGDNHPGLLLVSDAPLLNKKFLQKEGIFVTEAKMENTLDRVTAKAHPRTIERVPAGSKFDLRILYRVDDNAQLEADLQNIFNALRLVEKDGLGGNVSRGYGQCRFHITRFEGVKASGQKAGGLSPADGKVYTFEECTNAFKQISFA